VRGTDLLLLTSATDGGEYLDSRPVFLTPRELASVPTGTGNWEDLTVCLDNTPPPLREMNTYRLAHSPSLYRLSYLGFFLSTLYIKVRCNYHPGRSITQAVIRWLPTAAARVRARGMVKWYLRWTKWHWDRFSQSTSASPANFLSTKFSFITITRGRYNRTFSGRRAEWTQYGIYPRLPMQIKKIPLKFVCIYICI
jgi:hypothetical protein